MQKVVMYTTGWCGYCARARSLLESKNVPFEEIDVDAHPEARAEMMKRSGRRSVPQIFIGETHVGGCDDLHDLEASGGLDPLLNQGT
ncbi:MAG: glutaredoxin 3 [Gammaproteobacteria bacterium]